MPYLFEYLFKLSLSLGVVFLFYQFVLRRLTFYNWNRVYLLGYTLLSFWLPFVDISRTLEQTTIKDSMVISWVPMIGQQAKFASEKNGHGTFSAWDYGVMVLLAGVLFLLARLGIQLWSIRQMRKKSTLLNHDGMRIYQVGKPIIPFSFGNSIFINKEQHNSDELEEIIRHEFVHVKQKHSVDIIWGELLCLLNWYNPFAWLLKKSIRQNLEFIADRQVLKQGMDRKQYQYLLLKVIGNNHFSIANQFNFSSLKKRIAMMNKFRSAKVHLVKFLFMLPLLSVLLLAFRNNWKDAGSSGSRSLSSLAGSEPGKGIDTIPDKVMPAPPPPPATPVANPVKEFLDRNPEVKEAGWVFRQDNTVAILHLTKKDGTVERINVESEEERKAAEKKYGPLPYPPPPPAPAGNIVAGMPLMPPPPPPAHGGILVPGYPAAPKLPENVESIEISNGKARVSLKNGTVEQYDFANPAEKKAFEKKYGTPPPPPPAPAMPKGVRNISIHKDNKATVFLQDGKQENYDLSVPAEKETFIKKYGTPPPPPPPPGWSEDAGTAGINSTGSRTPVPQPYPGNVLYILNGKISGKAEVEALKPETIEKMEVLKGESATRLYGKNAKEAVIRVTTKDAPLPLYVVDGVEKSKADADKINPAVIVSVDVVKGENAKARFGQKGKNGVVVVTTRN
ncbi:MAG: hypothetical protein HZA79_12720 [Sphingobacteriales bacterium]|nr:hypothetical protein [Sphingobacteriales bacterium]